MATNKTLNPTGVTIAIPAMADKPDASVFSNCIDKEADAINTLNSNLGITNITIDVSTYTYNTQEGATALFTVLPSPFKGVCYASFANGLKAIVTANKTNNNYGSMTYTVDYDVEPYYYGKRNTSIVFDRIALASNTAAFFTTFTPSSNVTVTVANTYRIGKLLVFTYYMTLTAEVSRLDVLGSFDLTDNFLQNFFNSDGQIALRGGTKNVTAEKVMASGTVITGQLVGVIS